MENRRLSKEIDESLSYELDPAYKRRARIIFENLDIKGGEKILDVGCGRGFYLKAVSQLFPRALVTGLDINKNYLEKAKEFLGNRKVKLVIGSATELPFNDKSFDRIICSELLEHIKDDRKAIAEIHRVLKPDGIALITVPNKNYPFLWDPANWLLERIFGVHLPAKIHWLSGIWADHVRLYSEKELVEKFNEGGFSIEKKWLATHWCFPFSHFLLYGIGKNLVEAGLISNSFNRFSNKKTTRFLLRVTLFLFDIFDRLNKKEKKRSVNIILKIRC